MSYARCDYLKYLDSPNDLARIENLYENELYPYLNTFDETRSEKVGHQIYYRLQRNWVGLRDLLDRISPPKEAPMRFTAKPIPTILKNDLKKFKNQMDFYYFEVSGDTTKEFMKDGFGIDTFTKKNKSKLSNAWLNDSEY